RRDTLAVAFGFGLAGLPRERCHILLGACAPSRDPHQPGPFSQSATSAAASRGGTSTDPTSRRVRRRQACVLLPRARGKSPAESHHSGAENGPESAPPPSVLPRSSPTSTHSAATRSTR